MSQLIHRRKKMEQHENEPVVVEEQKEIKMPRLKVVTATICIFFLLGFIISVGIIETIAYYDNQFESEKFEIPPLPDALKFEKTADLSFALKWTTNSKGVHLTSYASYDHDTIVNYIADGPFMKYYSMRNDTRQRWVISNNTPFNYTMIITGNEYNFIDWLSSDFVFIPQMTKLVSKPVWVVVPSDMFRPLSFPFELHDLYWSIASTFDGLQYTSNPNLISTAEQLTFKLDSNYSFGKMEKEIQKCIENTQVLNKGCLDKPPCDCMTLAKYLVQLPEYTRCEKGSCTKEVIDDAIDYYSNKECQFMANETIHSVRYPCKTTKICKRLAWKENCVYAVDTCTFNYNETRSFCDGPF